MQKETAEVELTRGDIARIWRLFEEHPAKRNRHLAISREMQLPARVVRAVIASKYRFTDGKAIVTVPIADPELPPLSTVVAGQVRGTGT